MILNSITNLFFLIVGIYLGALIQTEIIIQKKNKVLKKLKLGVKPGGIKRPDSITVYNKNKPNIKKEGDKAMLETLDRIPELKKAKDLLNVFKRKKVNN